MGLGAIGQGLSALAAVVPSGHIVGTELLSCLEETVELNLAVAENVGVGGSPCSILIEHIVHNAMTIIVAKVDKMKGYAKFASHGLGIETVVHPRAVAFEDARGVGPVAHKESRHIVALLLKQVGGHAGINTSR